MNGGVIWVMVRQVSDREERAHSKSEGENASERERNFFINTHKQYDHKLSGIIRRES